MDLRDKFAVHCAAALVGALEDPAFIARRAYDLADALLAERAQRIPAAEAEPSDFHPLFDPDEIDPEHLEPPYDPSWDVDIHPPTKEPDRSGPGLARALPPGEESPDESMQRSTA